jgi:hypothetical protein
MTWTSHGVPGLGGQGQQVVNGGAPTLGNGTPLGLEVWVTDTGGFQHADHLPSAPWVDPMVN